MRKYKVIAIFFLLFTSLFLYRPFFVLSESELTSVNDDLVTLQKKIEEKKSKIKQLEESISKVKNDINKKQIEAKSLKNQLAILDSKIRKVELDVEVTEEKLSELALEIEKLNIDIGDKSLVIQQQKVIIAKLFREFQQSDDKNNLEVLAAYNSFSEFYNEIKELQSIEEDLGQNIKILRISKENLQVKHKQKEEIKKSYEDLNNQLLSYKEDLGDQVGNKQRLLNQTKADERTYQTLLVNLKKQYQDIENEVSSIERMVRKKLEEQEKLKNIQNSGPLSWPTQSRRITAYFYDPEYPYRYVFEHNAIDIKASQGTLVKAAASGYVARAKKCSASTCYSYVMLIHSEGISTVYGHLSSLLVTEDQFVTRGDVLGYSGGKPGTIGAGPFTTGPHLHFEVRKNGLPVNPLNYLVKDY